MKKILAFDTLRFLLAICVVLGHTFVVLVKQDPNQIWCIQNLAVDGFFILSGFLLAMSCVKYQKTETSDTFCGVIFRKASRLWPEYTFSIFYVLVVSAIFGLHVNTSALPLNLVFLSQINHVPGIVNGSWYISVLFWCIVLYTGILLSKNQTVRGFLCLFVPFIAFTIIYSMFSGLSLNEKPFVWNMISAGFFKGLMDLGVGVLTYYISNYLVNSDIKLKYPKATTTMVEVVVLITLITLMNGERLSRQEYFVVLAFPILIGLFYSRQGLLYKIFSWHSWSKVAPWAYSIFLTHCVLLEVLKILGFVYPVYSKLEIYGSFIVLSVLIGGIVYYIQRLFFKKLKLFVIREVK